MSKRRRPRGRANPRRTRSTGIRAGERASSRESPLGGEQVEGRRAVLEVLRSERRRARHLWLAGELDPAPIVAAIRGEAERAGVPISVVSSDELIGRARTDASQGVILQADPLPVADADELLVDPRAFVLALDGVTDPGNLGAVLRSAEGAGVTGAVLPKRRSVHVTPTVAKAAAGAIEHLPLALVPGIPAFLDRARRAGVWTVGLDGDADDELFDLEIADQPLVLVVGAEGRGLARLTRERCDVLVRIPMHGRIESLNVGAAGAVACYEVSRAREGSGRDR